MALRSLCATPIGVGPTIVGAVIMAASVVLQGLILFSVTDFPQALVLLWIMCVGFLSFCFVAAWWKRKRFPHLDVCLVVAGLGGLGMLVGSWMDAYTVTDSPLAHLRAGHVMHGLQALWSWRSLLMCVSCLVGCFVLCERHTWLVNRRVNTVIFFFGNLGMLTGMLLGGMWFAKPLRDILGSVALSSHAALVIGMVAGTYLTLASVNAFLLPGKLLRRQTLCSLPPKLLK